jgi:hypothetical protein
MVEAVSVERIPMRQRTRIPRERSLTGDSSSRPVSNSRSFESYPVLNSSSFDSLCHDHGTRPAPRVTYNIPGAPIADSLAYKSIVRGESSEKSTADFRLSCLAFNQLSGVCSSQTRRFHYPSKCVESGRAGLTGGLLESTLRHDHEDRADRTRGSPTTLL